MRTRPALAPTIALASLLMGGAGCPSVEPLVEPTPWIYDDDAPDPAPSLSTGQVEAAIEEGLAVLFALDPRPAKALFDELMTLGDPGGCPFVYETNDGYADVLFWQDTCQASGGAVFDGYGYVYDYVDYDLGEGLVGQGWALLLSGELMGADGARLEGSGVLVDFAATGPTYDYVQRSLNGSFLVSGRTIDVTGLPWLDGSRQPDFELGAIYVPEVDHENFPGLDARQVSAGGAVSGLLGDVATVAFDAVVLTELAAGSVCQAEPSGTISARADDGSWVDVVFDVGEDPAEPLPDAADCDGCGQAWSRGALLGTVCVDFGVLLGWEGSPW